VTRLALTVAMPVSRMTARTRRTVVSAVRTAAAELDDVLV
jgi:DNA-binding IclR family transcriptional regulator